MDIFGRPKSFQGDADNDSEVIKGTFINDAHMGGDRVRSATGPCCLKESTGNLDQTCMTPLCYRSIVTKSFFTGSTLVFTSVFGTDTLPPPRAFSQQPTLPHSGKLPTITQVLFFQTACKMTSRRCIVDEPVSAKQAIVYYFH